MSNPLGPPVADRRSSLLSRAITATFGVVLAFLVLEVGVRYSEGRLLSFENFILGDIGEGLWAAHPLYGTIPRPYAIWSRDDVGMRFTFGENSIRLNGNSLPDAPPWLLATGDSYTFGAYMNDTDTWPSILERQTGKRVINAGVDGFGLDQAVLRAIELNRIYSPEIIVVSFIPHNIVPRCEMSNMFNRPKPYFELEGEGLRLVPPLVQERPIPTWVHKIGGYSLMVHKLMNAYAEQFWHCWVGMEKQEHSSGREVGCRLMAMLAADPAGAKTVILAQHRPVPSPEDLAITEQMLVCARNNQLKTFDILPALNRFSPEERATLFNEPRDRHMSAKGNHLVADELKGFLESLGDDFPRLPKPGSDS